MVLAIFRSNYSKRNAESRMLKQTLLRLRPHMYSHMAILYALHCGISTLAHSTEQTGTVCLGSNYAKPLAEHTKRLYLKVNDSSKIYFLESNQPPRIVIEGLTLGSTHTVYVYFDNKLRESWKLNFGKLGSHAALIWRAGGSWRMEPIDPTSCASQNTER